MEKRIHKSRINILINKIIICSNTRIILIPKFSITQINGFNIDYFYLPYGVLCSHY